MDTPEEEQLLKCQTQGMSWLEYGSLDVERAREGHKISDS